MISTGRTTMTAELSKTERSILHGATGSWGHVVLGASSLWVFSGPPTMPGQGGAAESPGGATLDSGASRQTVIK